MALLHELHDVPAGPGPFLQPVEVLLDSSMSYSQHILTVSTFLFIQLVLLQSILLFDMTEVLSYY